MMRIARWILFAGAAVGAAIGLWTLGLARFDCSDPRHGCAYLILAALMLLGLALAFACAGTILLLIERSRASLKASPPGAAGSVGAANPQEIP